MPSYNQVRFIEDAIQSVLNQSHPDRELIFIDGGSTDGTVAVAEKYRAHFAHFVSEPDDGQSHALEKGFARATGDVLTWLNTDDMLLPGALSEVASLFSVVPDCHWVFGNVVWTDAVGTILDLRKGEEDRGFTHASGLLSACGPSAFFTPELLRQAGGIDRDLHYKMDTDLWYRFRALGRRYRRLRTLTWSLRLHEDAKVGSQAMAGPAAERHREKIAAEALIVSGRHAPPAGWPSAPSAKLARASAKLMSPNWIGGLLQAARWKGRPITELCAWQSGLEHAR